MATSWGEIIAQTKEEIEVARIKDYKNALRDILSDIETYKGKIADKESELKLLQEEFEKGE